ncbi:hypothetical protein SteCoe_13393 [Stentor coeruleus]|uniref:Uncharacterized protein n=1 Tax=Stentor coeruleus TaxID=5963 RepID=A0A1R2C8K9_9CILI|nr:hypothetical protein SteCoe_13393 [Stentor coeruleus]
MHSLAALKFEEKSMINLPDIAPFEKKAFRHNFALKKNKTLKVLGASDNDSEFRKPKQSIFDSTEKHKRDTSNSFISVKLKIHTPIQKKRIPAAKSTENLATPGDNVKIEISMLGESEIPFATTTSSSTLSMPPVLYSSNCNFSQLKFRNKRINNIEYIGKTPLPTKNPIEDPFYYANMKKNASFSSFRNILDGQHEVFNKPYPYFGKTGKAQSKAKTIIKKCKALLLRKEMECKCPQKNVFSRKLARITNDEIRKALPRLVEVKLHVPILSRIHFYPQKVKCFKNIVIVYFEGTFGIFSSKLTVKHGVWKLLRKLSNLFQLILVIPSTNSREIILQYFELKKILIAGVYSIHSLIKIPKSSYKFQDYSQIYIDFDCQFPHKNCIIIANHKLFDECEKLENFIYQNSGLPKLNAEGIPVSSYEYPETPHIILLPDARIESDSNLLEKVVGILSNALKDFRSFRDNFNFGDFFTGDNVGVVRTCVAHHLFLESMYENPMRVYQFCDKNYSGSRYVIYCKVHGRYYREFPMEYPIQNFIVK